MLSIIKKKFVYMASHHRERGFTFLTLLVTVTILVMTLPFVNIILKTVTYSSNYNEVSIQQFFYFLRDDVIKATDYQVESNAVTLDMFENNIVTIEKYDTMIRRQVNGQGHEIYLRDVKEVVFTSISHGIHVSITSIQGETYEKTFTFYK